MENKEMRYQPKSSVAKIWNHFVPRDAQIEDALRYGIIDGAGLSVGSLGAYYLVNENPLAIAFLVYLPALVITHINGRRSANLHGDPRL